MPDRKQVCITLEKELLKRIDRIRGRYLRSYFIEDKLREVLEDES